MRHHRAAASSKVGKQLRGEGEYDKAASFNYFLTVLFPDNQLKIIDYNRLIIDLNNLETAAFLKKLAPHFEVELKGKWGI